MKKVAFHTLGCKVNTYESEAMRKLFVLDGYEVVDFKQVADVYVINTCTVTNTGDSKSRQMIRRAIRTNPDACVCVTGCYSQVAKEEIEAIEGVGVILGTQYRNEIVELANHYLQTGQMICKVDNIMKTKRFEDLEVQSFAENTRAFLKIEDGCVCGYHLKEDDNQYWWAASRFRKITVGKDAEMLLSRINELEKMVNYLSKRVAELEHRPVSVNWSYGNFR